MTGNKNMPGAGGRQRSAHPVVVVMGVSASGKSAVGAVLAERLGVSFVDGDDLHPQANVAKMAAGEALNDHDRWPWLARVGIVLAGRGSEAGVVVACSALRRVYRDRLRESAPEVVFVHLTGEVEILAERASGRAGHFMPPALLTSQLSTLEPLELDETGVALNIEASVDELAADAEEWIRAGRDDGALAGAREGAIRHG